MQRNKKMIERPKLTPKQIADRLGVTRQTVMNRIKSKELRATKFGGRWYCTEEQYRAFLAEHYIQPNTDDQ